MPGLLVFLLLRAGGKNCVTRQGQSARIGIISAGDIANDVRPRLNYFISEGIDTIVCCTRTRDRGGSTFQMIETEFRPQHPVVHVRRVARTVGGKLSSTQDEWYKRSRKRYFGRLAKFTPTKKSGTAALSNDPAFE